MTKFAPAISRQHGMQIPLQWWTRRLFPCLCVLLLAGGWIALSGMSFPVLRLPGMLAALAWTTVNVLQILFSADDDKEAGDEEPRSPDGIFSNVARVIVEAIRRSGGGPGLINLAFSGLLVLFGLGSFLTHGLQGGDAVAFIFVSFCMVLVCIMITYLTSRGRRNSTNQPDAKQDAPEDAEEPRR